MTGGPDIDVLAISYLRYNEVETIVSLALLSSSSRFFFILLPIGDETRIKFEVDTVWIYGRVVGGGEGGIDVIVWLIMLLKCKSALCVCRFVDWRLA